MGRARFRGGAARGRHVARAALVLGSAAAVAGCTLLVSLDGLSGGAAGTSDAAPAPDVATKDAEVPDAPPPSGMDGGSHDAGGDALPGGMNVMSDPGFEDPVTSSSGCGGAWIPYHSTITRDTTAHQGSYSCRVCRATSSGPFTLDEDQGLGSMSPGSKASVTAWMRLPPGAAGQVTTYAVVRVLDASSNILQEHEGDGVTLTDAWQLVTSSLTATTTGNLNVYFPDESPMTATECFLVDDVDVERSP